MINQEILNTLEEKKFISSFQLEKIKTFIKSTYENDFKGFYKHYKDYYNHKKKLSFNKFVNELIEYLIKDNDTDSFKFLNDYVLNMNERENRVYSFFEELKHKDTDTLKNYNVDNDDFDNDFFDNDIVEDVIKNCFDLNDNEYKKLKFEDSGYITYLEIEGFNILEDFEHYDNFKEFFEDLENLIYGIDLKQQVYIRFLLDNNMFDCYLTYDDKGINKLDDDIKKEIKVILEKRLKVYEKDLRKVKITLKKLEKELLNNLKPLLKESVKTHIEKVNNHIDFINKEIKTIKTIKSK